MRTSGHFVFFALVFVMLGNCYGDSKPIHGSIVSDDEDFVAMPTSKDVVNVVETLDYTVQIDGSDFSDREKLLEELRRRLKGSRSRSVILTVKNKATRKEKLSLLEVLTKYCVEQNVNLFLDLPTGKGTPEGMGRQVVKRREK